MKYILGKLDSIKTKPCSDTMNANLKAGCCMGPTPKFQNFIWTKIHRCGPLDVNESQLRLARISDLFLDQ